MVHQIAVEPSPPPPPPPPPHNLHQMTDAQIRQWIRKRVSHRLKNEDIEVKRTSEEILITIKLGEQTETIGYRLTR
jgi:ribosomal protein S3